MTQAEYLDRAEEAIVSVLHEWQPKVVEVQGTVASSEKEDGSVVTKLDQDIEKDVYAALQDIDSSVGFLGEEGGQRGSSEKYWLADPIDGTAEFIRGLKESYRSQYAYVEDGVVKYALAYRFATNDLYTCRTGEGTYKNGERVRLKIRPLAGSLIEMSFNLLDPDTYAAFCRLRPNIKGMMVTRDYLKIIDGVIDGYLSMGAKGNEWDYAPLAALLSGAGLQVANVGSNSYDVAIKNMVAVHPEYFEQVQSLLSPQA